MRRKDITVGTVYTTSRHGNVKVVDLGPFEKTYNRSGDRMAIDGITTFTRRTPGGRYVAVREVLPDGTLVKWIGFLVTGSLHAIPPVTTTDTAV